MKINKEVLKSFNPCVDRWRNYLEHYSEFQGSFDEFIDLDKISYEDKIWIGRRVLDKNQLCHFGLLCAESVLSIFENKYPEDKRVGDCIRHLVRIKNFSDLIQAQREEIWKHRNAAYAAAAYAAYDADAGAAYAAANAAYAAATGAAYAAYAADAAANAADAAYAANDAARKMQQDLNLDFLKVAASLWHVKRR